MNKTFKMMDLSLKPKMKTKIGKQMAKDLERDINTQTDLIIQAISKLSPLEQEVFNSYQQEFDDMMEVLIQEGKHREGLTPETIIAICFYMEILSKLLASSGTILIIDKMEQERKK